MLIFYDVLRFSFKFVSGLGNFLFFLIFNCFFIVFFWVYLFIFLVLVVFFVESWGKYFFFCVYILFDVILMCWINIDIFWLFLIVVFISVESVGLLNYLFYWIFVCVFWLIFWLVWVFICEIFVLNCFGKFRLGFCVLMVGMVYVCINNVLLSVNYSGL